MSDTQLANELIRRGIEKGLPIAIVIALLRAVFPGRVIGRVS